MSPSCSNLENTRLTAGAGLTFPIIGDRLEVGIELLYAESQSDVDVSTGSALTSAPLPRLKSRVESAGLRGGYRLRDDLMLNLRYWYERRLQCAGGDAVDDLPLLSGSRYQPAEKQCPSLLRRCTSRSMTSRRSTDTSPSSSKRENTRLTVSVASRR